MEKDHDGNGKGPCYKWESTRIGVGKDHDVEVGGVFSHEVVVRHQVDDAGRSFHLPHCDVQRNIGELLQLRHLEIVSAGHANNPPTVVCLLRVPEERNGVLHTLNRSETHAHALGAHLRLRQVEMESQGLAVEFERGDVEKDE